MRKALPLFLIILFFMSFTPLQAQEEGDPDEEIPADEYIDYKQDLYSFGDQTFNISVGTVFPTVFLNASGNKINHKLFVVGGQGALSYNYFLGSNLFAGLELSLAFNQTDAENMYFVVPINIRLGYQFILSRFEFPVTLGVGMAPQQYVDQRYFGFFMKPSLGVYFRFSPEWSFGLETAWWWVPEWTRDKSRDVHGNFVSASLAARYHF